MAICFWGSEYFAQRFNRPFDKIRVFLYPKNDVFGQNKMGCKGGVGEDFDSNVPQAVLIDP